MKTPNATNEWYVITGAPSSGTSTTAKALGERGYPYIEEAARLYIDEGFRRGLTIDQIRQDEIAFQENVASLKSIIELTRNHNETTFFVRGMPDTAAYAQHLGFTMPGWLDKLVADSGYKGVFLLDPLESYDATDPARIESRAEAQRIGELLANAYVELGMQPVIVPALPALARADFILEHIDPTPR